MAESKKIKYLCVYCGSKMGQDEQFKKTAAELGTLLAKSGWGLVYGGGNVGLMGVVADAVMAAGGPVIGVIPDFMISHEVAHEGLTELIVVPTMHDRKMKMAERADAFLALPGGFGTYDELFEMVTWAQLKIHEKPILMLNDRGFYDDLLKFLENVGRNGFISVAHLSLLKVVDSPMKVIERLTNK
jgi:uncharacterized protein (TIGR00730 family)